MSGQLIFSAASVYTSYEVDDDWCVSVLQSYQADRDVPFPWSVGMFWALSHLHTARTHACLHFLSVYTFSLSLYRRGYDPRGKTAVGTFLGKANLCAFLVWACKGRPDVFPSLPSQLKLTRFVYVPPTRPIVSYKVDFHPLYSHAEVRGGKKSHYLGIIITEDHFPGYYSNQFTCALKLTSVIHFTTLLLLKPFNIKQEECHQLQLMLCFPPLLMLSE